MWMTPATHDHLHALAPQLAQLPLIRAYHQDTASLLSMLTRAMGRGDQVRVALAPDGLPLGLSWSVRRGAFGTGAYLRLIAVVSEQQNCGLGGRLLEDFEAVSDSPPGGWFALVSEDNTGAQLFYQRHHYHSVGKLAGFVRPDRSELIFHRAQK